MKFLFILIILIGCNSVWAQEKEGNFESLVNHSFDAEPNVSDSNQKVETNISDISSDEKAPSSLQKPIIFAVKTGRKRISFSFLQPTEKNNSSVENTESLKLNLNREIIENDFKKFGFLEKKFDDSAAKSEEKFHWKPALEQSGIFLGIQHGFRLMQKKTQRELDGPFFRDWGNSVKNLRGWADGDNTLINYGGHPMQGAATGRIFINNSEKSRKLEFGTSKDYWTSRMKAMAWSAAWSTQFELGPISEATIGNVGVHDFYGPSSMAWVDLIMTPTAGTGVLIGEDIIDKYILKNWLEKKLTSRTRIKVYRTFLNPITSFVNILGGKQPWKRYNR